MKRWNCIKNEETESPKNVESFLEKLDKLCKEYNISISHEDGHGAFELEYYDKNNIEWINNCHLNFVEKEVTLDDFDLSFIEQDSDRVVVADGDMFEGTREQFANCFFSNATNAQIIQWCSENDWDLSINNIKLL